MTRPAPQPRGLRRDQAAGYVGVSKTTFDAWVRRGLMPQPFRVGTQIVLWDRLALDSAFSALSDASAGAIGDDPDAPGPAAASDWDEALAS